MYSHSFQFDDLRPTRLLKIPLGELPQVRPGIGLVTCLDLRCLQIVFTLRAVQQPLSIPVSLASLHLVQRASNSFMASARTLYEQTGSISDRLSSLRQMYEASNIANTIVDGTTPFPENQQSIRDGIAVEFRYFFYRFSVDFLVFIQVSRKVSFRYPGSEDYALRDVSFKVNPGQLCVRPNIRSK